jgi:hypothetical protein
MRIQKSCRADDKIDIVADQLALDDLLLGLHHVVAPHGEIFRGNVFFDSITRAVEVALPEAGEKENRLAQGLAGNRAAVDADSADDLLSFDDTHFLADLRCLDGCLLTGRTGADHEHVIMGHG